MILHIWLIFRAHTQELDAILKSNKAVKVVIPDWVMESVRAKKLLPERPYFVERKPTK